MSHETKVSITFQNNRGNEVVVYRDGSRLGLIKYCSYNKIWEFKQYDCTLDWLTVEDLNEITNEITRLNTGYQAPDLTKYNSPNFREGHS